MANRSKTPSAPKLKAAARTLDQQLALEDGELAALEARLRDDGLGRKEVVLAIVEIVMSRLDGYDAVLRHRLRARLLDRIEKHPAFADLGPLDWAEEEQ